MKVDQSDVESIPEKEMSNDTNIKNKNNGAYFIKTQ